MKKYRTGIQKQVLNVIDYGCNVMKLPYVTIDELKQELKQPNETENQLNHRITQATYQLKKKRQIVDKGYGKYAFNKNRTKHYAKCTHLITKNKRDYCPIKKHYVQGAEQCIAIEDFDGTRKVSIPKCIGYSRNKNDKELSVKKFKALEAKDIGTYRHYNGSQLDPESKCYLPNLANEFNK